MSHEHFDHEDQSEFQDSELMVDQIEGSTNFGEVGVMDRESDPLRESIPLDFENLFLTPDLMNLLLSHRAVRGEDLRRLLLLLDGCPSLTHIDLSHNDWQEEDLYYFLDWLRARPHVHLVDISGQPFSVQAIHSIYDVLIKNHNLEILLADYPDEETRLTFLNLFNERLRDRNRLTIELVPSSAWYTNVRSSVTPAEWNLIRLITYKKAHYHCEICGGQGTRQLVDCHEKWLYDDEKKIQQLISMIALCPSCHEVKHRGFANMRGRGEIADAHLANINGWSPEITSAYVKLSFFQWRIRSGYHWQLELDHLNQFKTRGIELYQELGPENQLTFLAALRVRYRPIINLVLSTREVREYIRNISAEMAEELIIPVFRAAHGPSISAILDAQGTRDYLINIPQERMEEIISLILHSNKVKAFKFLLTHNELGFSRYLEACDATQLDQLLLIILTRKKSFVIENMLNREKIVHHIQELSLPKIKKLFEPILHSNSELAVKILMTNPRFNRFVEKGRWQEIRPKILAAIRYANEYIIAVFLEKRKELVSRIFFSLPQQEQLDLYFSFLSHLSHVSHVLIDFLMTNPEFRQMLLDLHNHRETALAPLRQKIIDAELSKLKRKLIELWGENLIREIGAEVQRDSSYSKMAKIQASRLLEIFNPIQNQKVNEPGCSGVGFFGTYGEKVRKRSHQQFEQEERRQQISAELTRNDREDKMGEVRGQNIIGRH